MGSSCQSVRRSKGLVCVPFPGELSVGRLWWEKMLLWQERKGPKSEPEGATPGGGAGASLLTLISRVGFIYQAPCLPQISRTSCPSPCHTQPHTHTHQGCHLISGFQKATVMPRGQKQLGFPLSLQTSPFAHSCHSLTLSFLHSHICTLTHLLPICPVHSSFKLVPTFYFPIHAFIHLCYSLIQTLNPSHL